MRLASLPTAEKLIQEREYLASNNNL